MSMSFLEKTSLYRTFNKLKDNPKKLAMEYKKDPQRWEKLKKEYPDWRNYVAQYPELAAALRKEGVPL